MILAPNGLPAETQGREGLTTDLFAVPQGSIIDFQKSKDLLNRVKNNATLRENIEKMGKMTGKKALILDAARGIRKADDKAMNHQEFGDKIMKRRIKEENIKQ